MMLPLPGGDPHATEATCEAQVSPLRGEQPTQQPTPPHSLSAHCLLWCSQLLIFSSGGLLLAAEPLQGPEPPPLSADEMSALLVAALPAQCDGGMAQGAGGRL